MIIETARLRLVPLTLSYVTSAPDDRATLARETGAEVPASWPPELWDQAAQDWTRRMLEQDAATDWIPRCIVLRQPQPIVCGVIGIAAPDADGRVLIGYGVLPEFRRRGYAALRGRWFRRGLRSSHSGNDPGASTPPGSSGPAPGRAPARTCTT